MTHGLEEIHCNLYEESGNNMLLTTTSTGMILSESDGDMYFHLKRKRSMAETCTVEICPVTTVASETKMQFVAFLQCTRFSHLTSSFMVCHLG